MPQSLASLLVHLVFSTKDREPWLTDAFHDELHAYIGGIMNNWVLVPDAYDLGACAPALVDSFLTGLRVAPPRSGSVRGRPGEVRVAASLDVA